MASLDNDPIFFFGIVMFMLANRCTQTETRRNHLLAGVSALAFMLANAYYGLIFIISLTAAMLLAYIFDRRTVYLRTLLIPLAALIAYRFF